ncbi:hypothetical protein [Paramixta manurensis]|uniref:hypothetical protein n=1 Tax=Paramixta manurensis TaxID=2740817 RepID=UPI0033920316
MKVLKWAFLSMLVVAILCWLVVRFIASDINEKTTYTEKDLFNYFVLTDRDINQAPRISSDYYFESQPGDGYAPSNAIIFKNVADVSRLRDYLQSLGYSKEPRRLGENEVWSKSTSPNGNLFYLSFNRVSGQAVLTKVTNR